MCAHTRFGTHQHKGPLGVSLLNRRLKKVLNPEAKPLESEETDSFDVGDKVMQVVARRAHTHAKCMSPYIHLSNLSSINLSVCTHCDCICGLCACVRGHAREYVFA